MRPGLFAGDHVWLLSACRSMVSRELRNQAGGSKPRAKGQRYAASQESCLQAVHETVLARVSAYCRRVGSLSHIAGWLQFDIRRRLQAGATDGGGGAAGFRVPGWQRATLQVMQQPASRMRR